MGCWVSFFFIIVIVVMTQDVILGAILTICGGIFFLLFGTDNKKHISKVKTIPILTIKDIIHTHNITKEEMGTSGYFKLVVAVEGFIRSNQSLKDKLCYVERKDSFKKELRITDNRFYIEDGTGQIVIKTDKPASFYDNYGKALSKERRPTQYTEIIRHVDGSVYVIGEVSDATGELVIQKPKDFNDPFIIAFTSEQEYIQQKETVLKHAIITGRLLTLIGIIFLLLEIIK